MSALDNPYYDNWKLNPPDEKASRFICDGERCNVAFYPDDTYYLIEGMCLCEDCARDWLEEQAKSATERDCYD